MKKQHLEEIFANQYGKVYQSDRERCFWLEFQGEIHPYKMACLQRLKQSLDAINLVDFVANVEKSSAVEIIYLPNCKAFFVLTLTELIALKELLAGTWAMLALNQILYERLYPINI